MEKILIYDSGSEIYSMFLKSAVENNIELVIIEEFRELLSKFSPKKNLAIIINTGKEHTAGEISTKELVHIIKMLDPDLPIIVAAEKESLEVEKEIRLAGIFYYMVKPFNQDEILSILHELLTKSKSVQ
jgi:DNA-binding NtrC family response regulator